MPRRDPLGGGAACRSGYPTLSVVAAAITYRCLWLSADTLGYLLFTGILDGSPKATQTDSEMRRIHPGKMSW